jgi:hypothetical protein
MYDGGAYFCVTGARLDGAPADVMERASVLAALHAELLGQHRPSGNGAGHSDRELALSALGGLSARRGVGYHDWLGVGMSLHSVATDLLGDWDAWSQRCCPEKYQEGACERKWKSFKGKAGGLTIGSLIYWAKQDGWAPPGPTIRFGGGGGQKPDEEKADEKPLTGYDLILSWFWDHYEPVFRRHTAAYSGRLGREVKPTESCWAPPRALVELLATASDAPRERNGTVKRHALPQFFNTWAKSAWVDMLNQLPEEEQTEEVNGRAEEEFRAQVAAGLNQLITLGEASAFRNQEPKVERRSVIDWCARFAREGPWRSIRSYQVWTRLAKDSDGRTHLQVAVRAELFAQIKHRPLESLTPRRFRRLCEAYGVGTSSDSERPHGCRAVVLPPDFIEALLADPNPVRNSGQTA